MSKIENLDKMELKEIIELHDELFPNVHDTFVKEVFAFHSNKARKVWQNVVDNEVGTFYF